MFNIIANIIAPARLKPCVYCKSKLVLTANSSLLRFMIPETPIAIVIAIITNKINPECSTAIQMTNIN